MAKQRMKSAERHATSLGIAKKRKAKSGQGLGRFLYLPDGADIPNQGGGPPTLKALVGKLEKMHKRHFVSGKALDDGAKLTKNSRE